MKKHNIMKVVLLVVTALWLISAIFLPDSDWAVLVKTGLSLVELFLILFSLKEKNNTLKVVIITTFVLGILTWILPASYASEYLEQGRSQMGLFDLLNYSFTVALPAFGYLLVFVLMVGGFYGILYKIPAYRSFLDKIVALCKGKEAIALSTIMVILAVLTSVCGIQVPFLVFFPMLASLILLMGYDKIVVALALAGSTMIGVAGTTFGYSNTGILNVLLGLELSDNVFIKVVILFAGLVLLIFNTLMYAKRASVAGKAALKAEKTVIKTEDTKEVKVVEKESKVKADTSSKKKVVSKEKNAKNDTKTATSKTKKITNTKASNSTTKKTKNSKAKASTKASRKDNKAAAKGDDVIVVKESLISDSADKLLPKVVDSKHKIWPIIVGFALLFVITILAFTPWSDAFELEIFINATEAVKEFELFGFPIFAKLLGNFAEFGVWEVKDLTVVIVFVSILLTFIYKVNFDDAIDGFIKGVKKALLPTFIIFILYTCLVVTVEIPYQLAVYQGVLGMTEGFNVVTSTITGILSSLFNIDPLYSLRAVATYFTVAVPNTDVYPIAAILFQSVCGVSMLFVPTSFMLATVLSYLGISYKEWMKSIWKLLLELFVVLLLVFIILILI